MDPNSCQLVRRTLLRRACCHGKTGPIKQYTRKDYRDEWRIVSSRTSSSLDERKGGVGLRVGLPEVWPAFTEKKISCIIGVCWLAWGSAKALSECSCCHITHCLVRTCRPKSGTGLDRSGRAFASARRPVQCRWQCRPANIVVICPNDPHQMLPARAVSLSRPSLSPTRPMGRNAATRSAADDV